MERIDMFTEAMNQLLDGETLIVLENLTIINQTPNDNARAVEICMNVNPDDLSDTEDENFYLTLAYQLATTLLSEITNNDATDVSVRVKYHPRDTYATITAIVHDYVT